MCKSAPRPRQKTMPAPQHSVFYRPDAFPAAKPTASKHWRPWYDMTIWYKRTWKSHRFKENSFQQRITNECNSSCLIAAQFMYIPSYFKVKTENYMNSFITFYNASVAHYIPHWLVQLLCCVILLLSGVTLNRNVRRILVTGSMPSCRLGRRKFWKFDYEMVHSEVYLNKYAVSIAPFSTPACHDCSQNIT